MATKIDMIPSSSDDDDRSSSDSETNFNPRGRLAKWFEFDDDDSDDDDNRNGDRDLPLSAAEKATKDISDNITHIFDSLMTVDEDTDDQEALKEEVAKVNWEFIKTALNNCAARMKQAGVTGNLDEVLARLRNISSVTATLTRSEVKDSKQWKAMNEVMKSLDAMEESVRKCNAPAFQTADEGEEGADEDAETNEEYYIKQLTTPAKNIRYDKIVSECERKGYVALVITALSQSASACLATGTRQAYVTLQSWKEAFNKAARCFELARANDKKVTVADTMGRGITARRAVVSGGFRSLILALYVELRHIGQAYTTLGNSTSELIICENDLLGLTDALLAFYQSSEAKSRETVRQCCSVLLEIIGYRRQAAHDLLFPRLKDSHAAITPSVMESLKNLLALFRNELKEPEQSEWISRCYCHWAFQLAVAGEYYKGRELLLRAGFQEDRKISRDFSDKSFTLLPGLYNRAIAQLGISAFVQGDLEVAHDLLEKIYEGRNKYLLQFFPSFSSRAETALSNKQFLEMRDTLIPSQTAINLEQLEVAALLSALIVNLSRESSNAYKESNYSRALFSIIKQDQVLSGNTRNFYIQIRLIHMALKKGNYQEAKEVVRSFSRWEAFSNKEEIIERYLEALKESALKIFCYANRCNFTSVSVSDLEIKYELSSRNVRRVLNEMIANDLLVAYWEKDDEVLYFDRNNATQIQYMVMETSRGIAEISQYTQRQENSAHDNKNNRRPNPRGGRY